MQKAIWFLLFLVPFGIPMASATPTPSNKATYKSLHPPNGTATKRFRYVARHTISAKVDKTKLFRLLESNDKAKRKKAVFALAMMQADVFPDLIKALQSEKPRLRSGVEQVFQQMGSKGKGAQASLTRLVQSTQLPASWSAAMCLAHIGPPALPTLSRLLKSKASHVRGYVTFAIAKMSKKHPKALQTLILALGDKEPQIRFHALQGLVHHKTAFSKFEKELALFLKHRDYSTRRLLLKLLYSFKNPSVSFLVKAEKIGSSQVSRWALNHIKKNLKEKAFRTKLLSQLNTCSQDVIETLASNAVASSFTKTYSKTVFVQLLKKSSLDKKFRLIRLLNTIYKKPSGRIYSYPKHLLKDPFVFQEVFGHLIHRKQRVREVAINILSRAPQKLDLSQLYALLHLISHSKSFDLERALSIYAKHGLFEGKTITYISQKLRPAHSPSSQPTSRTVKSQKAKLPTPSQTQQLKALLQQDFADKFLQLLQSKDSHIKQTAIRYLSKSPSLTTHETLMRYLFRHSGSTLKMKIGRSVLRLCKQKNLYFPEYKSLLKSRHLKQKQLGIQLGLQCHRKSPSTMPSKAVVARLHKMQKALEQEKLRQKLFKRPKLSPEEKARRRAERRRLIANRLARSGVLALIGAKSHGGGSAISDIIGSSNSSRSLDEALRGVRGVKVAVISYPPSLTKRRHPQDYPNSMEGWGLYGRVYGAKHYQGLLDARKAVFRYIIPKNKTHKRHKDLLHAIKEYQEDFKRCYQLYLRQQPGIHFSLLVSWQLQPGKKTLLKVIKQSHRPKKSINTLSFRSCFGRVVRALHPPKKISSQETYPGIFKFSIKK